MNDYKSNLWKFNIASMVVSNLAIFILPGLGMIVDRSSLSTGLLLLVIGTLIFGFLSVVVERSLNDP